MRSIILDIVGLTLIACIGALEVIYPQKMYDLFIFGLGRDNHRRWSPERGRGYRLAVRIHGAVMLVGAMIGLVLLVTSK
jgi:hypothetical protein